LEEVIVLLTLHPLELRTESESAASQQTPGTKPAAQAPTARP
jgi:hypothetical protein